jgi:hypothetical protein
LDPETGEQLDMIEFEDALTHSPVISDGVIYVAGHSYEPVLEDVLIAVATLPAPPGKDDSGASIAATATPDR